jgi:hypothetical protein
MTFFTHTLVTTACIQVMHLQGKEIILAYLFGVAIDLDHLFKMPLYLKKNKMRYERHYHWRTPLQEPVALLWIIPLAVFVKSIVPIVFSLSHLLLDYLLVYPKLPFFPFSKFSTRGVSSLIPDQLKELLIFIIALVVNLFLFYV